MFSNRSCATDAYEPNAQTQTQTLYAGNIIDIFDRRLLQTYIREYIGDFLFNTFQSFRFHDGGDGGDGGGGLDNRRYCNPNQEHRHIALDGRNAHSYSVPYNASTLHEFVGMIMTSI